MILLSDRQYTAPSAANPVSMTPSGSAWANSAYVTVLAATPSACILTGVVINTPYGELAAVSYDFEVDIATGGVGAEVVIATVRGCNVRNFANMAGPTLCWVLPIPIDNIAAGVRISARIRKGGTNTTAHRVAITYLKKPLASTSSLILTTAVAQKTLPSAASGVTVTAGSPAYANGSWAQLRAATGAALVITGIVFGTPSAGAIYELDLGTGGSGSEAVITTLRVRMSDMVLPAVMMLPNPLDNVAASTRLAARLRSSSASATMIVSLMVMEKPL